MAPFKRHFIAGLIFVTLTVSAASLPKSDMQFLGEMTRDVIVASTVQPNSNGNGNWPITNTCGFPVITPGKDTYPAYWVRDFSMAIDSGFISAASIRDHLILTCKAQNGSTERKLAHGLHVPPWCIPDHVNYDGLASFYPGSYGSGEDQGDGTCGKVPPIDDHYEFVHIAYVYWKMTGDSSIFKTEVNGVSILERLEKAFASPTVDTKTGLAETTEKDRAVGFGFCDAETHTGKLLFASLLRYRAAGELAEISKGIGRREQVRSYKEIQKLIQANIVPTFSDPKSIGGWLRASTEISRQADVWGTLYALELGVLPCREAAAARRTILEAMQRGTIAYQGGVRHVPTDLDFSKTTSWERSASALNTYQNGAYWHTASGWLIKQVWKEDRKLALQVFNDMIVHLRAQDFRKGPGHHAPWEDYWLDGQFARNPVYMVSVALPFGVLKRL